jgi:hypothetical protein
MPKKTVRKVLRAALAAAAIYAVWLAYSELSFRTYRDRDQTALSGDPGAGNRSRRELRGVYHVHTSFSDGHATVDEVEALAARQGLDFVVLTDHGNPNHASLRAAGLRNGVLVLAGSELNVNRGHLVAMGFRTPPGEEKFPSKAEDAVAAVKSLGGFTVIAHPYSKVKWSWGDWGESSDYSGIEIVNADTMFKNNYRRVLAYAPLLIFGSRLPLIRMLEYPASNLKRWDERGAKAAIAGYFSADAHLYYRGIFGLLRLHVLVDRPRETAEGESGPTDPGADEDAIWDALRHGRFYNAVEAVADASGFRFEAFDEAVELMRADLTTRPRLPPIYGMGDTIVPGMTEAKRIRFRVLLPHRFRKEIRLLRDGRVIAATDGDTLDVPSEGPGVYRVEVYLKERSPLGADIPWIVSNPIYLRKE